MVIIIGATTVCCAVALLATIAREMVHHSQRARPRAPRVMLAMGALTWVMLIAACWAVVGGAFILVDRLLQVPG